MKYIIAYILLVVSLIALIFIGIYIFSCRRRNIYRILEKDTYISSWKLHRKLLKDIHKKTSNLKTLEVLNTVVGIICFIFMLFLTYNFFGYVVNRQIPVLGYVIVTIILPGIPIIFALRNREYFLNRFSKPYSYMTKGILSFHEDKLVYSFWQSGDHGEYNKFTYTISKENIKDLAVKDGICIIHGVGILKIPEWAGESQSEKCNVFSFLMDFSKTPDLEWWSCSI